MKRHYVNHTSRVTYDHQFVEILDLLREEGLFDEHRGRACCQVRVTDKTLEERQYLYLWADRTEAEAFLDRLRQRNGRDWRVFEVEVVKL